MPVLRDMVCTCCGDVVEDVFADAAEQWPCACSSGPVEFVDRCNGGLKARYRMNDWPSDPEFWRGQSRVLGAEAVDSDGNPVRKYDSATKSIGDPMGDNPKYKNGSDQRETRRDMIKHATRRKRGTLPLVLDMGSKNG